MRAHAATHSFQLTERVSSGDCSHYGNDYTLRDLPGNGTGVLTGSDPSSLRREHSISRSLRSSNRPSDPLISHTVAPPPVNWQAVFIATPSESQIIGVDALL